MKKIAFFVLTFTMMLFVACGNPPKAAAPPSPQIVTPVKWTWTAQQTAPGEYKLIFTATIDKGWHTYSQYIGDGGPVPTKFTFDDKNKDVQLVGKTTETGPKIHDEHDPVFNMQLKYFEVQLVCTQTVKVLKDTKLKGSLEFMVCDDKSCLPPDDKDFEFDLKAGGKSIAKPAPGSNGKSEITPVKDGKTEAQNVKDEKAFLILRILRRFYLNNDLH